jgi:hypothetical protein
VVGPLVDAVVARTPGSFTERKSQSLAFHYRVADFDLALARVRARTRAPFFFCKIPGLSFVASNPKKGTVGSRESFVSQF